MTESTTNPWEARGMRIGKLASRTGVSVRSLRYYEEQGLLNSTRSASGQRHYTEYEVERVSFVQQLYAAGLSSRTIVGLLPCVESPSEENSENSLQRMIQERDRLSRHIADLMRTWDTLDGVIASAREYQERTYGPHSVTPRGPAARKSSPARPSPASH